MKLKLTLDTGFAGCTHEDEEFLPLNWNEWSEEDKEGYIEEAAKDFISGHIDCYTEVVEDED